MKSTLLFFGIFLTTLLHSNAQPANNDCATAEVITVSFSSATNVSYNPSTATQSTQSSCDNVGTTYNDVWYSFTMPNAGNIQITNASNTERFTLYDACGGTEIDCFNGNDYFLGLSAASYVLRVAKQNTIASADSFTINTFEIPDNDECTNPEIIVADISTQQSFNYDNRGATESLDASCDNASNTYLDVWYEFTMPFNGNLHITGVNIFDRFAVFDSCGGSEVACGSDDTFAYNLTTGTYLLRVSKQLIYASADSFNMQAFATVVNDECAAAEVITEDISTLRTIVYDNRGATESLDASCDNASSTFHDIWYEFTMPVNGNVHITGVNIFDRFTFYDTCGGSELACFNDDDFAYGLTTGTYLLRVSKQDIYASVDSFNIQAFAAVANDECATAELITADITTERTISFDNRGATESLDASCDSANNTHLDIWYQFTMPVNGNLQISGVNIFDRFTLYNSCGGIELACFNDDGTVFNLTTGTYFLRAYSQAIYASSDSFRIQAFATVANDECATAEVITDDITTLRTINFDNRNATESLDASCDISSVSYQDIWYEFTMPIFGNLQITGVDIFDRFTLYDSCGGSEIACFRDDGFVYNLSVGTYYLRVYSETVYASEDSFNIQAFATVANDECATAEVITDDITTQRTINFDNRGATESLEASCDNVNNSDYLDIWYEFTMPATGNIKISGVNTLNRFTLYDSCGGSEIMCFQGNTFVYNVTMGTYFLRVYSFSNNASQDSFNIQAFATATNNECATAEIITDDISIERTINIDNRTATQSISASCDTAIGNENLDLWYEFTMPFQGNVEISNISFLHNFTLYNSCGGSEITCFNGSGLIYELSAGNYLLRISISSVSADADNFNIQAFEELPNNDCANAEMISVAGIHQCNTQSVSLDVRGSTETFAPNIGSCFSSTETWLDAWYAFEAPITGNISLNTTLSSNTYAVYESCGGNEIACFQGSGLIPVVMGNTYYIQVAKTGNFLSPSSFCLEAAPLIAPGTPGICESMPDIEISVAQGNTNDLLVPIFDASGNIVATIFPNGNDLGTVSTTLFIENADTRDFSGQPYLRREVSISTSNPVSGVLAIYLYVLKDEVDDLILADSNLTDISELGTMKVNGTTCSIGYVSGGEFISPGTNLEYHNDYRMTLILDSFSIFYPTSTDFSATLSTSSTETNELGITALPTVTDGIVNLSTAQPLTDVAVNVFDITGRNIYQTNFERIGQTQESINLSGYQSGIYFMKITHQNTQVTKRIVLK
ncbi:MAG: T9SS type A sorting domain-containing protein [Bacteroidota bacterium]